MRKPRFYVNDLNAWFVSYSRVAHRARLEL